MNYSEKITEATNYLSQVGIKSPTVGIVLGTGLGKLINQITIEQSVEYNDIPHFPQATVEFHAGRLVFGKIGEVKVICMQGRFHAYEGYTMQEITFPIRVMNALGISKILLSNAAGGINLNFKKGDLVLLDDHIDLQSGSPLAGLNDEIYGPRFPDMSQPYSKKLNQLITTVAESHNIKTKEGVYVSVLGPNLETRAEYRFLKIIGADMVGMSTVPEVIVANQLGLECSAVSVITDECDPDNLQPVDISEIIEVAGKADEKLSSIFAEVIKGLG